MIILGHTAYFIKNLEHPVYPEVRAYDRAVSLQLAAMINQS